MTKTEQPRRDERWTGPDDGRRVLIEHSDGAMSWAQANVLAAAGFRVAVCDGPDRAHGFDCPVLSGGRCELADEADLVVSSVWSSRGGGGLALALHAQRHDRPVLRERSAAERALHPGDYDVLTALEPTARGAEFLETVQAAFSMAASTTG